MPSLQHSSPISTQESPFQPASIVLLWSSNVSCGPRLVWLWGEALPNLCWSVEWLPNVYTVVEFVSTGNYQSPSSLVSCSRQNIFINLDRFMGWPRILRFKSWQKKHSKKTCSFWRHAQALSELENEHRFYAIKKSRFFFFFVKERLPKYFASSEWNWSDWDAVQTKHVSYGFFPYTRCWYPVPETRPTLSQF